MQSAKVQQKAVGISKPATKAAASKAAATKTPKAQKAQKATASKTPKTPKAPNPFIEGFDLLTKPSQEMKDRLQAIKDEEAQYPMGDNEWNMFFLEYFKYIEENIENCLKKLPNDAPLKKLLNKSQTLSFLEGGYDDNTSFYELLFSEFKDGTNKLNGCIKINFLLRYIGNAVLRLAEIHKENSGDKSTFYTKIVVILELAVYPEVFLFCFEEVRKSKPLWNQCVWIRKQEYFGIIPKGEKRNYDKGFDTGLTRFIRNYIRRAIIYMRIEDIRKETISYQFGYENPYIWNINPINALQNPPLPLNSVYIYKDPDDDYDISSDDWKHIPDFLLPNNDLPRPLQEKNYIDPKGWNKPPPDWWIDRTKTLLGFIWWKKGVNIESKRKALEGTKKLEKWKKLNSILPGNYENIAHLWDYEYKEYIPGKGFLAAVSADVAEADAIVAKTEADAIVAKAAKAKADADAIAAKAKADADAMSLGGNRSKSKTKAETVNKNFQLKKLPKTPKTPKTAKAAKTATKSSRKPRLSTAARALTV